MADSRASGVELAKQSRAEHAIERVPTGITAFVGRTLKGPVNRAVVIGSFAEFQRIFGGLWQPATLAYAVEQFFESGGRQALVVRVVNAARCCTIRLPSDDGELLLTARNPGSREYLRASVDHDGVPAHEPDRFNLVLQRVRSPGSELIEDQEIFRRVSVRREASRCVSEVLLASRLVRVAGELPAARPRRTVTPPGGSAVGYAHALNDGDDGAPLSDYDLIGSAAGHTGMFALVGGPPFNFLCVPPLTREQDVGLSTLLVAARICRESHALLIVDPPASWDSAEAALDAMRGWPFRSDSALMYYPRLLAADRLRGRIETFASCGAAAGIMARNDETWPIWSAAESEDAILRAGLKPAVEVSDADRARLNHAGVNVLMAARPADKLHLAPRTLASGVGRGADWKYLSARRLALFLAASIEQGTRWALLEPNVPATWERARALAASFLDELGSQGAFAGAAAEETHFVIADERVNRPRTLAEGKFNLLFGFAPRRPAEFDTWLVTHQPGSSRVRPITVNRAVTSTNRVAWEIETSILTDMKI